MILASYGNYSLSPPHRLPLSIPLKIAIIKNSKHAGDDGKKEEARKASLPLFLLPIVPPVLSFLLLPSLPTTQRGLWGGESNYYLVASTRWRSITHISLILVNITLNRLYWSINPLDETFDLLNLLIARSWSARERSAWYEIRNLCNKQGLSSSSSVCDPWSFFRRTDQNKVRTESSIRSSLGPVNMDKSCLGYLDHPPSPATLGEPTFHTFSYKTWRTVYMKNKRLRSPGRSCSTYLWNESWVQTFYKD